MPNIIVGASSGSDNLTGTTGNDVFKIEGGNDTIVANGGIDTIDYEDSPIGVTVNLATGVGSGWGSQHFSGIDQVVGSFSNDTLIGGADTNYMFGLGGNDSIHGGDSGAVLQGGSGNDTITGGAGNDDIQPGGGNNVIDGGGGFNTIDYSGMGADVGVDLYSGGFHSGQVDKLTNIQNIIGNDNGDVLKGDLQWNIIIGGAGADSISSFEGNDQLTGHGGNDLIDGGSGQDTAIYSGAKADYTITSNAYGWVITDNRPNSPDGTDTVRNVETLQFSDGSVQVGHPNITLDAQVMTAISLVLRENGSYDWTAGMGSSNASALANDLSFQISTGAMTEAQAVSQVIVDARDTASVATLSYEFFTGSVPSSGGMDFLIKPDGPNTNNLNSAYYQSFNIENRFINFAVNLGSGGGAGATNFQSHYGSLSLSNALSTAYQTIFGETPTADKVNTLLNTTFQIAGQTVTRAEYFAIYGGHTDMGTKAAMVGWLLSEAVKANVGDYALSNQAFLTDVATHNAAFGVDIIGHYDQPGFAFHG